MAAREGRAEPDRAGRANTAGELVPTSPHLSKLSTSFGKEPCASSTVLRDEEPVLPLIGSS